MNWRTALVAASVGTTSQPLIAQQTIGEERVIAVDVNPSGISFKVSTHGCTHRENFGLQTLSLEPLTLRLLRLRPDYCEATVPNGTTITFTYAEIGAGTPLPPNQGAQSVVVVNSRMPP